MEDVQRKSKGNQDLLLYREVEKTDDTPGDFRVQSGSSSLKSFLDLESPKKNKPKPPPSLRDKWGQLLFNDHFADIHIRVGADTKGGKSIGSGKTQTTTTEKSSTREESSDDLVCFPCHKLVLVANSPFFWNLFKREDLTMIRFVEFSPDSISIFLKFLYMEELDDRMWSSPELILHLLELSQKFQVSGLRYACIQNFPKLLQMDVDQIFITWLRAREYNEKELEEFTCKQICDNAEKLMTDNVSQAFLAMNLKDLKCLLEKDELQVEELVLFHAAIEWAAHKCKLKALPPTGQSYRRVLKDAVYLIRFPLMTTNVFTNIVLPKGILSADEASKILRLMYLPSSQYQSDVDDTLQPVHSREHVDTGQNHSNNGASNPTKAQGYFSSKPRIKPGPLFTVSRFGAIGQDERQFGKQFYSCRFLCHSSIALVGFGFYGPGRHALRNLKRPTDKLELDFQVDLRKFDGSLFTFASAHKNISLTRDMCRDCQKKLMVTFDYPVTIQPNMWYHVQYRILGPSTFSGDRTTRRTKTCVNCKGQGEVQFHFMSFPENSDENQLPDLIFKFFK